MAILLGNDISKWQGDVDFNILKNNANFVIFKTTEGNGYTDPKFSRNQSEARRVKLLRGYYHFARPDLGNDPIVEADWFLNVIGKLENGELLCLDYEPEKQLQSHVDWCKRWLDRVQEKTGVKPLIYLNQSQVKKFNWQSVVDASYGLWIAAYTFDPMKNTYEKGQWPFAAMQQWTNSQTVPGINGKADGNVFFGNEVVYQKYGYAEAVVTPTVDWEKKYHDLEDLTTSLREGWEEEKKGLQDRITQLDTNLAECRKACEYKDTVIADKDKEIEGLVRDQTDAYNVKQALTVLIDAVKRWIS